MAVKEDMSSQAAGLLPVFCTITNRTRLGYSSALVASLRRLHPDSPIITLYLGPEPLDEPEWPGGLTVIRLDELGVDKAIVTKLQGRSLSNEHYLTALQAWLLDWALDQSGGPVVFVADDVYVLGSLALLADRASMAGVALVRRSPPLTPTTAATLKRLPEEPAIDFHVMGLGASGKPFLEAWKKAANRAATTPEITLEDFMDRAADSFSAAIIEDRGYNLGWWNTAALGPIAGASSRVSRDCRVVALHLHGFDFQRPYQIVSRPDGWLPLRLSEHTWLADLCAEYAEIVRQHQPPGEPWPTVAPMGDATGIRGDHFAMACLRRAREAADIGRSAPPPDLRLTDDETLIDWLGSPPDGSHSVVSRYLLEVYSARPDLQLAFPDLMEAPNQFLRWARTHGRAELTIPGSNGRTAWPEVPHPRYSRAPRVPSEPRTGGVNVVGLLGSHLGLGEAGRQTVRALRLAGVPSMTHALVETEAPPLRQGASFRQGSWFPVNLLHMNPPELLVFKHGIGKSLIARRYNVGLWVWETETVPAAWRKALSVVDEIWVPSEWVRTAFIRETSLPVITIPHPVPQPWHPRYMDRRYLGLEQGFTFLFLCDLASSMRRKNLLGLVAAFSRAFQPNEGPRLVIKTMNGELNLGDFEHLLLAVRERPDIAVYDRVLSAYEKTALLDACDCYVSLHRAEGFGLTMAEAMALGKPVIATAYSGNLDYMTPQNSYLVKARPIAVGVDWDRYPGEHSWAEPDLREAAHALRTVWEHREEAEERGRLAARDVQATCSPEVVGRLMRARIEAIWGKRLIWTAQKHLETGMRPGSILHRLGARVRRWGQ